MLASTHCFGRRPDHSFTISMQHSFSSLVNMDIYILKYVRPASLIPYLINLSVSICGERIFNNNCQIFDNIFIFV